MLVHVLPLPEAITGIAPAAISWVHDFAVASSAD